MKYFYKIAFVFLLLLLVWHFFSTTEYFSQKEQKALKLYQKIFDFQKPFISGKINEKNMSVKETQKFQNKAILLKKEVKKYENKYGKLSPTQEKKIQTEILRRNPWVKNLIY